MMALALLAVLHHNPNFVSLCQQFFTVPATATFLQQKCSQFIRQQDIQAAGSPGHWPQLNQPIPLRGT